MDFNITLVVVVVLLFAVIGYTIYDDIAEKKEKKRVEQDKIDNPQNYPTHTYHHNPSAKSASKSTKRRRLGSNDCDIVTAGIVAATILDL